MDAFLSGEDNVVPVPWLYVHSLRTHIPEIQVDILYIYYHILEKYFIILIY